MRHKAGVTKPPILSFEDLNETRICVRGVEFDEDFLAELVTAYLRDVGYEKLPTITETFDFFIAEHPSSHLKEFRRSMFHYYAKFCSHVGDIPLHRLKRVHATRYRDALLESGLHPNSVRKHIRVIKSIINVGYRHFGIDRVNPFAGLGIRGEGTDPRRFPTFTKDLLLNAKRAMLEANTQYAHVGLIQLNTGMRVSEPCLAKLEDFDDDHPIPHLWVRRNEVTNRKTASSIRAVPLLGVSLKSARELRRRALEEGSEWLVPQYGRAGGNFSCSQAINRILKPLGLKSHMLRHAFVDRLRADSGVDVQAAEAILGHCRGSKFSMRNYGWIANSLDHQRRIIAKAVI